MGVITALNWAFLFGNYDVQLTDIQKGAILCGIYADT